MRRVEMISSWGERASDEEGEHGVKLGGVMGAGKSASLSSEDRSWRA